MAKEDDVPRAEQTERQPGEQKRYTDILTEQIEHGLGEIQRPAGGLVSSGFSAGLDIGLGVLIIAVMLTLTRGELPASIVELPVASSYALGFIFVILGRCELFTEHTTLAAFPVLAGRASLGALGRLWGLAYVANQVGAAFTALVIVIVGTELGVADSSSFGASKKRELTDQAVRPPLAFRSRDPVAWQTETLLRARGVPRRSVNREARQRGIPSSWTGMGRSRPT